MIKITSRFGSVLAHLDLDGELSGSSPGHTKDINTATQPVLDIISLSKGNALYSRQDKGDIIQRAGCLIR